MKLNLLPKTVATDSLAKSAFLVGLIVFVVCTILSAMLVAKGKNDLATAQNNNESAMARAQKTKDMYDTADTRMGEQNTLLLARNIQMATAMQQHCTAYPRLYDMVRRYVPSFYRLNAISATPIDGLTCAVTFTGTIDSFQHYADVMLALWRIPGAVSVDRSQYTYTPNVVPALTPDDQVGTRIPLGSDNLPTDPMKRLDALRSTANTNDFQNTGNFGGDPTLTRGSTPNESLVTIVVTLPFALQTPNPQGTLSIPPVAAPPPAVNAAGGSAPAAGAGS